MPKEIERKFLVVDKSYKSLAIDNCRILQAYLSTSPHATVRIRIKNDKAYITVKGLTSGCVRDEWEYPIPVADAIQMAKLATNPPIEKTRWYVPFDGYMWEVDEFHGNHEGLIIAEVELKSESDKPSLPLFTGQEVTGDSRYYNSSLAMDKKIP